MSNKIYRIETYPFSETDAVFFDANVWLYIYGSPRKPYPRLKTKYTLALRRIRSARATIFIDLLVLSEFINAYARMTYNDLPEATKPKSFKMFRNSDEFKSVAEQIAKYSRRILSKCDRTYSALNQATWVPYSANIGLGRQTLTVLRQAQDERPVSEPAWIRRSS